MRLIYPNNFHISRLIETLVTRKGSPDMVLSSCHLSQDWWNLMVQVPVYNALFYLSDNGGLHSLGILQYKEAPFRVLI